MRKGCLGCAGVILCFWALGVMLISLSAVRKVPTPTTPAASVNGVSTPVATPAEPKKPDLEMIGKAFGEEDGGYCTITGRIRNNTQKNYRYVQVTFWLANRKGEMTGTAMANIAGLLPGGVWKFTAHGASDPAGAKYGLKEITGF